MSESPARILRYAQISLVLASLAVLAACQDKAAEKSRGVQTASPFAAVAEGKADIEGGIIQVAARSPGVVRSVSVIEGDHVRKGQVLATQEDDAQRLAVQTAAANLAQIEAQTGQTEVEFAAARREKQRLAGLGGVVSRQQIDQAADALAQAEAKLRSDHAAAGVARAQLAEARYRLEQTITRAPVDGVIARRYANPGFGASTLNVTPLFDLAPVNGRIVRAEVTEAALPLVKIGQEVALVAEADQTKTFPGKVLREASVFGARKLQSDDPAERTDEKVVEVVVNADQAPFLIGQRVLVKFYKR